jgi:Chlorophyllase enzyme
MAPPVRQEALSSPGLPAALAWVARPDAGQARAVRLLVHGFAIPSSNYRALAHALAGGGYVVVVPDVYAALDRPGAPAEVRKVVLWAARVGHTFRGLPFVLGGHSRGGQACLLAVLAAAACAPAAVGLPPVDALVLLDIVEGAPAQCGLGGLRPRLLADVHSWPASLCRVPVLVVGAQLGGTGRFPAAPPGHNFSAVWLALAARATRQKPAPAMYLVEALDFGHLDYLNEQADCEGLVTKLSQYAVRSGAAGRAAFHCFTSAVVSEFLNAHVGPHSGADDARDPWLRRLSALRGDGRFVDGDVSVRARATVLPEA